MESTVQKITRVDTRHESAASSRVWHRESVEEIARHLETDAARGLTGAEVARRFERFGPNDLTSYEGRHALRILAAQFKSLIVLLLIAAGMLAFFVGDRIEAGSILVVIVINALIGFLTEWKAEHSLAALRKQIVPTANVIRDGQLQEIRAMEIVPGDIVLLAEGNRVPADGRVIEAVQLHLEEAALTGESQPREKNATAVLDTDTVLADRINMAYLGTAVTRGRGRLLVTATGMTTEAGHIEGLIERTALRKTPLEEKLDRLGRVIVAAVGIICAVIVVTGWLHGIKLIEMLKIGISLAIAALPEGLPAVTTMTLALGVQRMARMRTIVRRLPAVEALGSVTVICADKTGTLTRNEMTVETYVVGTERFFVTGKGYAPIGEFRRENGERVNPESDPRLALALRAGALCNDARLGRPDDGADNTIFGDPTEAALLVAAAKGGMLAELHKYYPRLEEIPFTSERKRMTTVHRAPDVERIAFLKGSPGTVLELCNMIIGADGRPRAITEADRETQRRVNERLAASGLRVLALAFRELPEQLAPENIEHDLTIIGLVGMRDPIRDEAPQAVERCRRAGIRPIMLTGDQPATAAEIGRCLGLDRGAAGEPADPVHARVLERADTSEIERLVARASIFARVSPHHKLKIVEALQRRGEVVAMTGDGVNDAPALKRADIGIAMGIKGTEVAKEASSMIITDDNFATIVEAVEQGRMIFANILKFIRYLFSCNFAEILTVFIALLIGWPLPLAALQILWLNMITDVFPAFALALEPSAPNLLERPPQRSETNLLSRRFIGLIVAEGLLLGAVTLSAFAYGLSRYGMESEGLARATTLAFTTLAFAQIFHAFNARSGTESIASRRRKQNPWLWGAVALCAALQIMAVTLPGLRRVLHTVSLSATDWSVVIGMTAMLLLVIETAKFVRRRFVLVLH